MKPEIVCMGQLPPDIMKQLNESFIVHELWHTADARSLLAGLGDRVTGIATTGGKGASAKLMDALPKAKIVASFSVGTDSIDLKAAVERGVKVTNTPDVLTDEVADLAIGLLVASARQIPQADRFVRSGQWLKGDFPYNMKIGGKTIGILGAGRIGQAIGRRAEIFGLKVLYNGPRRKSELPWTFVESLTEMARQSHFLMVACPGGKATFHVVDAEVLAALGKKGTLINIARGSVVDEQALIKALQAGVIGAAALDVFEDEPRVPEVLFGMDNVILQPHQASATVETRNAMGQLVVDNLRAWFAGQPLLTPVV
jgi:hydroxypyruvate reductase